MFSQFLGHYLVQNDLITAEQFSSCMDYRDRRTIDSRAGE